MDKQKQDNQPEPTYNSSVPIEYVALKTYQKQWMIEKGGERGSGRWGDMMIYIYLICMHVYKYSLFNTHTHTHTYIYKTTSST